MARLDRITTKGGDEGRTSLGDGRRVGKHDPRVEALGEVDELNAVLGVAALHVPLKTRRALREVQQDLFDAGADLAVGPRPGRAPLLSLAATVRLEAEIRKITARLPVARTFVLPGGTSGAAWCHLARTVCRRAERRVVAAGAGPAVVVYLNRLSDWLFVLARDLNRHGRADVLWGPDRPRPGRG